MEEVETPVELVVAKRVHLRSKLREQLSLVATHQIVKQLTLQEFATMHSFQLHFHLVEERVKSTLMPWDWFEQVMETKRYLWRKVPVQSSPFADTQPRKHLPPKYQETLPAFPDSPVHRRAWAVVGAVAAWAMKHPPRLLVPVPPVVVAAAGAAA